MVTVIHSHGPVCDREIARLFARLVALGHVVRSARRGGSRSTRTVYDYLLRDVLPSIACSRVHAWLAVQLAWPLLDRTARIGTAQGDHVVDVVARNLRGWWQDGLLGDRYWDVIGHPTLQRLAAERGLILLFD